MIEDDDEDEIDSNSDGRRMAGNRGGTHKSPH
jgi:hypothetical protein